MIAVAPRHHHVQVLANPAERLIWASPALPDAPHDMGPAREHVLDALNAAGAQVPADNGYYDAGPMLLVRSGDVGSIPTPAATGACEAARSWSTRPRPPTTSADLRLRIRQRRQRLSQRPTSSDPHHSPKVAIPSHRHRGYR